LSTPAAPQHGLLPRQRPAGRARQRRTRLRRVAAGSLLRGHAETGGNADEPADRGGRARRPRDEQHL